MLYDVHARNTLYRNLHRAVNFSNKKHAHISFAFGVCDLVAQTIAGYLSVFLLRLYEVLYL